MMSMLLESAAFFKLKVYDNADNLSLCHLGVNKIMKSAPCCNNIGGDVAMLRKRMRCGSFGGKKCANKGPVSVPLNPYQGPLLVWKQCNSGKQSTSSLIE